MMFFKESSFIYRLQFIVHSIFYNFFLRIKRIKAAQAEFINGQRNELSLSKLFFPCIKASRFEQSFQRRKSDEFASGCFNIKRPCLFFYFFEHVVHRCRSIVDKIDGHLRNIAALQKNSHGFDAL